LTLYPLKFTPILKDKIWGGKKIAQLQISENATERTGEAWILSGVENDKTVVVNGFLAENTINELIEIYMAELVGEKNFETFGNEFPLLYKVIDANDDLSVQVHPNDELALERHNCNGKSEMWYIMEAEKDAEIILGFNQDMNQPKFLESLENKTILDILSRQKVCIGDAYYIPSGCIHALCKGVLLAEIQQTSDITYRVWDWNRVDENGNSRELHVNEALKAINYNARNDGATRSQGIINGTSSLVKSPHFHTNEIALTQGVEKNYADLDSFVTLFCVKGQGAVVANKVSVEIKTGELVLIPATINTVQIFPTNSMRILETYIL
ncbi:MAG: class I mannose-6-phosphate isomerase, partial [Bacteroidales bacterium]|jgi:mannose-6-phosphate isomerase|nr:class I mannose-6-phosphate isomerase [Bacteroidales bacterium]